MLAFSRREPTNVDVYRASDLKKIPAHARGVLIPSGDLALGGASFFGSFSGGREFQGRFFNLIDCHSMNGGPAPVSVRAVCLLRIVLLPFPWRAL
ncbi:MAG TPA: hypothetical protein VJT10_11690 [Steroidobacteraceae bacterium]|nr:hypothetical protein [Steroidobacteraceae bacterium]